jgi:hypothetical protein
MFFSRGKTDLKMPCEKLQLSTDASVRACGRSLYWPTLVLSSVFLAFYDKYIDSGYFTICTRAMDVIQGA